MIRVACPHCHRTFRTMTEGMGITAVCSGCHKAFKIGSARPPFTWKPTSLAEDSWIGVEPPAEKKEIKHCIICDAPLEDGAFRCMACGANQVTGLVHKSRSRSATEPKVPFWTLLPIKPLIALLVFAGLAGGVFFAVRSMFTSVADTGVEMARHRMIMEAARQVASGGDPTEFAEKFSGKVTDQNLPRFVEMLEAGDAMIRNAAAPLIACGRISAVQPIVAKAASDEPQVAAGAVEVLWAIGPQRLAELSCDQKETIRKPAAQALCLIFNLPADEQTLTELSRPAGFDERVVQLNRLCRPWPRAVGRFAVIIGDEPGPTPALVTQIGRAFYMQIGSGTFASEHELERTFRIPVEQWCAATGIAVDAAQVRNCASGTVTLSSPFGTGWEGEARVKSRQKLPRGLPGFLPTGPLEANDTVTLPILLEWR